MHLSASISISEGVSGCGGEAPEEILVLVVVVFILVVILVVVVVVMAVCDQVARGRRQVEWREEITRSWVGDGQSDADRRDFVYGQMFSRFGFKLPWTPK